MRKSAPALLPFLIAVVIAEFIVRIGWVPEFLLPPPSAVGAALWKDRLELCQAFTDTALAAGLGLIASFVVGVAVAIVLSSADFLRRAFLPYAIFFQTVPIIAIAPLLVIWFGFGRPTVIASAFIVSIFPVIASTLTGLQATDPALHDLFRLYGASHLDHMFKLRLPSALPHLFSGLRIAAGLAVIGAIVGEFVGGGGIGSVVDAARTQQRTDLVFAAVLISSFLGLLMVGLVNVFARLSLRR